MTKFLDKLFKNLKIYFIKVLEFYFLMSTKVIQLNKN